MKSSFAKTDNSVFNNSQKSYFFHCALQLICTINRLKNNNKIQLTNPIKHKNKTKMELPVFANKLFINIYIYTHRPLYLVRLASTGLDPILASDLP